MKVLVYGAAGSQQFPLIAALQQKGSTVVAITHSQKNIDRLQQAGASVHLADMGDRDKLHEISKDIDAVALLIPFFLPDPMIGLQYAINAIDAAIANGVRKLVWNASGFILPQKIGNAAIDLRIDIRDYLKASGIDYIIVEPSVYAENLLGPWTAPFVRDNDQLAYPTPPDMRVGWIATQDVANIIAEVLYTPGLRGQSLQVSGIENLSGPALAEKFSIGLNRSINYYSLPPQEFGRILDTIWGKGAGDGAAAMYQQLHDTKQYPSMHAPNMSELLLTVPVKMTPIEDWVRQHNASFSR